MTNQNDWNQAAMMVMAKLEEHDRRFDDLEDTMILVRIDVARLKVKSGLWGAIAGTIPAIIGVLLVILSGGASAG